MCFLICMHKETSKFQQSVLTLVSPVSAIGIRDNNITYITPTMILYEDMKPTEDVLHHLICVLSHLICTCKHSNIKSSLFFILLNTLKLLQNLSVQKADLTRFFIIKPRHPGPLEKQIKVKKAAVRALVTCGKSQLP